MAENFNMCNGVIIYGTTSGGEAILQACREKGIPIIGYCDDSHKKIGAKFMGIEIKSFEECVMAHPEVPVIVGIVGIDALTEKLERLCKGRWMLCCDLLASTDYKKYTYTRGLEYGVLEVENVIFSHKNFKKSEGLFINNLDLVITTKCSLRCRDCSNLMQYYKHPENFPAKNLINDLESLLCYVSQINELRIIGGEPFMHPGLANILTLLLNYEKIKKITIYSNGTIYPKENMWKILTDEKIILSFTDYGEKLSRNLKNILRDTKERHIKVYCHKAEGWTKCSDIKDHGRSHSELEKVFTECCAKNLFTMIEGKVFRCPFMANANKIGACYVSEDECFDVNRYLENIQFGKEILKEILYKKDLFYACNYCQGRSFNDETIEPAIQTKEVLSFQI